MPKDPERSKPSEADAKARRRRAGGATAEDKPASSPAPADEDEDEDEDEEDDEDEGEEDDEEEDEDEEDEEDDAKPKAAAKPSTGRSSPDARRAKSSREPEAPARSKRRAAPERVPATPLVPDERVLDSPRLQTIGMLGVIAVLTVGMWVAGKAACNYHPPTETRKPRDVTTAEVAKDPKNAALELQQRWVTYDFSGALELAKGAAATQIQQEQQGCAKDQSACTRKKNELAARVMTTAVLLRRQGNSAIARVTSIGTGVGRQVWLMDLAQDGAIWKATTRRPDAAVEPQPLEPKPP